MTALSASPDKALPPRPPKVRFRAAAGPIYFPMLILGPIGERFVS